MRHLVGQRHRRCSAWRERCMQPRSLADDAATIADREVAVAFRKDRGKRPGAGRRKPQPQQVPLALGLRPVLVSRARVQDRMIV